MANQDLSTWSENDAGNRGTLTSTYFYYALNDNAAVSYMYKDVTSSVNFTVLYKTVYGSETPYGSNGNPAYVPLQIVHGGGTITPSFWCVYNGGYRVQLGYENSTSIMGQTHYCKIVRSGTSLGVYLYSDSGRTNLIFSFGYTVSGNVTYLRFGRVGASNYSIPNTLTVSDVDLGALGSVNATSTPTVLNVSAAVVTPTIIVPVNDTAEPDVVPVSVATVTPTIDIMIKAVFPL